MEVHIVHPNYNFCFPLITISVQSRIYFEEGKPILYVNGFQRPLEDPKSKQFPEIHPSKCHDRTSKLPPIPKWVPISKKQRKDFYTNMLWDDDEDEFYVRPKVQKVEQKIKTVPAVVQSKKVVKKFVEETKAKVALTSELNASEEIKRIQDRLKVEKELEMERKKKMKKKTNASLKGTSAKLVELKKETKGQGAKKVMQEEIMVDIVKQLKPMPKRGLTKVNPLNVVIRVVQAKMNFIRKIKKEKEKVKLSVRETKMERSLATVSKDTEEGRFVLECYNKLKKKGHRVPYPVVLQGILIPSKYKKIFKSAREKIQLENVK